MAIEIGNNQQQNYNKEKLATQGNVVNTLSAYNEQVKENYNDRTEDTSHNDTLQKSIETIVKSLDKSNIVTGTFEDKKSVTTLDTDNSKNFGDSGLIRKLDLITKAISPKGIDNSTWNNDIHANALGSQEKETISNVPVCALTKGHKDYEYKTNGLFNGNFNINGIENNPQLYVLSEKQISDMVVTASRGLIQDYTLKINQLKDLLKQSTARSMAAINYINNIENPTVRGYFPIDVSYDPTPDTYSFVTLNGIKVENVEANMFNSEVYFKLSVGSKITVSNSQEGGSYCKLTLNEGKFNVYQNPTVEGDTGYNLFLLNYRIILIVDSDIDLTENKYSVTFNGTSTNIADKIFVSPTNQFRFQHEFISVEGSDNSLTLPYDKDLFNGAIVTVNDEPVSGEKTISLDNITTDITIKVNIKDDNTRTITYYDGYSI